MKIGQIYLILNEDDDEYKILSPIEIKMGAGVGMSTRVGTE